MASLWQDIFNSDQQNTAQNLYGQDLGQYSNVINSILGAKSGFAGVNSLQDATNKFGLPTSANAAYQPEYANLATEEARANASAAERSGGHTGNPGALYGSIAGSYAPAYGNLGASEANANIGLAENNANFYEGIIGQQDAFGMNQRNQALQGLGAQSGAISNYLKSLDSASPFADVLGAAGTVAKFL